MGQIETETEINAAKDPEARGESRRGEKPKPRTEKLVEREVDFGLRFGIQPVTLHTDPELHTTQPLQRLRLSCVISKQYSLRP